MPTKAKLLWTSRLDNSVSLGTLDYVPPGVPTVPYYAKSDITGTDTMGNSKTQLETALNSTVNYQYANIIVTPDDVGSPTTLADFAAVYDVSILPNDFPGGKGNKLKIVQKKRSSTKWSGFRPQGLIFTTRTQNAALNTLYVRKKIKIPSNMVDVLSGSASVGWCEIDAIKCSHDIGNTVDLRYSIQVFKLSGESGLRFICQIDRGSGGTIIDTSTYPKQTVEGACNPGDTYLLEYYIKRPATGGASNQTDGLYQVVITNLVTNQRYEIANVVGGTHWGVNNGQFSLFYHYLSYTGGFPSSGTFDLEIADLEYWNRPPNALILPNKPHMDALTV